MTTPEPDRSTPDAGPGVGEATARPATDLPGSTHPDPPAAVTARWESDGGHLHR